MELHRDVLLFGRSLDWAVGQQSSVTACEGNQPTRDIRCQALKKSTWGHPKYQTFWGIFFPSLACWMNIPNTLSVGRHRKKTSIANSVNQKPLDTMILAEETARLSQQNAIPPFDFIILLYGFVSDCTKNWAGRSPTFSWHFFQTKRLKKTSNKLQSYRGFHRGFSKKNTP